MDIRGLTGWNALCLVPNSTALVGCMLLLRCSNDAMLNSRILHYSLRWCVCEIIKLRTLVGFIRAFATRLSRCRRVASLACIGWDSSRACGCLVIASGCNTLAFEAVVKTLLVLCAARAAARPGDNSKQELSSAAAYGRAPT